MKKIILLFVAVTAVNFAGAQVRTKGTVELIPQIGYSSSNYYGDGVGSGNDPIGAATVGVGGDYFFNNRWSLRSGLHLQTMGTEVFSAKEKLNYMTIPVNANWHFGSTRKWNLNFGPAVGFLTSASFDGNDIKSIVNKTQVLLCVGIGYKIEVSKQISILIDYQSAGGLTDISKDTETDLKNSYNAFDVGVVFKI